MEPGTEWHVSEHVRGLERPDLQDTQYMECTTTKRPGEAYYTTCIFSHSNGYTYCVFFVETAVVPKVTWLKMYVEMAGGPPFRTEPKSLAVLASRAVDKRGGPTPDPESTGYRPPEGYPWKVAEDPCSLCERQQPWTEPHFKGTAVPLPH